MTLHAVARPPAPDPYALTRQWRDAAARLRVIAQRQHVAAGHPWMYWTACPHPLCVTALEEIEMGPFGGDIHAPVAVWHPDAACDLEAIVEARQERIVEEWHARHPPRSPAPAPLQGVPGTRTL